MPAATSLFYLPESLGSADLFSTHWIDPTDPAERRENDSDLWVKAGHLEDRLKSAPPGLLIDLGVAELFDDLAAGLGKKSQRFLECCHYPTRLAVDLRPFVFSAVKDRNDLDLWDAVGKQLAWRLSAHKWPVALIWESPSPSQSKSLGILRDSLELWSGPELIHHNEPKPPEGGAIPIRRLCELLKI